MFRPHRLLGHAALGSDILGLVASLSLFGPKAFATSLARDTIGGAILRVASSNMTVYEGVEVTNEWVDGPSSISDKMFVLLFTYISISNTYVGCGDQELPHTVVGRRIEHPRGLC